MRKSYWICAAVLVVSLLAGAVAAAAAVDPIDEPTASYTHLSGSPAAAEGLAVYDVYQAGKMYWKIRLELGREPELMSDFCYMFEDDGKMSRGELDWKYNQSLTGSPEPWDSWTREEDAIEALDFYTLTFQENGSGDALDRLIHEELIDQVAVGEGRVFAIPASRFQTHYNYELWHQSYRNWGYYNGERERYNGLIRRPVDEELYYQVYIHRDSSGTSITQNLVLGKENAEKSPYSSNGYGYYEDTSSYALGPHGIDQTCAPVEKGCYFSLTLEEALQPAVQEDWFPHGFGIFFVPFEYVSFSEMADMGIESTMIDGQIAYGLTLPQFDRLQLVLPLDWRTDQVIYQATAWDGRGVFALTWEGETAYVNFFREDGTLALRQQLGTYSAEAPLPIYYAGSDFLALWDEKGTLQLYTREADGTVQLQFVRHSEYVAAWPRRADVMDMVWQDGRLAVCGDGFVQLYDAAGLLYAGEYSLSLWEEQIHAYQGEVYSSKDRYYQPVLREKRHSQLAWEK